MKPGKPDQFERVVLAWWTKDLLEINGSALRAGIAKLIRKEHMWMRLMVQRHLAKWTDRTDPPIDAQEAYGRHCRALQCREILDQLDQRRK